MNKLSTPKIVLVMLGAAVLAVISGTASAFYTSGSGYEYYVKVGTFGNFTRYYRYPPSYIRVDMGVDAKGNYHCVSERCIRVTRNGDAVIMETANGNILTNYGAERYSARYPNGFIAKKVPGYPRLHCDGEGCGGNRVVIAIRRVGSPYGDTHVFTFDDGSVLVWSEKGRKATAAYDRGTRAIVYHMDGSRTLRKLGAQDEHIEPDGSEELYNNGTTIMVWYPAIGD
jgi:hypothetical protein